MIRLAFVASAIILTAALLGAQQQPPAGAPNATNIQQKREQVQTALRDWLGFDPDLEKDFGKAGFDVLEKRSAAVGEQAAAYLRVRSEYEKALADDLNVRIGWLDAAVQQPRVDAILTSVRTQQAFLGAAGNALNKSIDAFLADTDKGIVLLRQALEKERAALTRIQMSLSDRQKQLEDLKVACGSANTARSVMRQDYDSLLKDLLDQRQQDAQDVTIWNNYYGKLAAAARGPVRPGFITRTPATETPVRPPVANPTAPAVPPSPPAGARWVGTWSFPLANGIYSGEQPEFCDVIIREENGTLIGMLYARFRLAKNNQSDPIVRFEFSGKVQTARGQAFEFRSADGYNGTIELLPGTDDNSIEVNWYRGPQPNRIQNSDVLLVKRP